MKRISVLLAAIAMVLSGCTDKEECKERKMSDGSLCLVCTTAEYDNTNKRISTTCVPASQTTTKPA
jgi:hypothetical protein